MSVITTECCNDWVDLDYNCDDIVYVNNEPYHIDCAMDLKLITEEQAESGEYEFTTERAA